LLPALLLASLLMIKDAYLLYSVVMNYYYPTLLEVPRECIQRSVDRDATVCKVGEIMDKHDS
jgi:hypothetical protein